MTTTRRRRRRPQCHSHTNSPDLSHGSDDGKGNVNPAAQIETMETKPKKKPKRKRKFNDLSEILGHLRKPSGLSTCSPTYLPDHGALTASEARARTRPVYDCRAASLSA